MDSLKKSLHNIEEIDNWLLLYHLGLFETIVFAYDYHYLFIDRVFR